jgi:lipopolysaccharide/colanic/teichoic acid biosynthesis glycosyltransferase
MEGRLSPECKKAAQLLADLHEDLGLIRYPTQRGDGQLMHERTDLDIAYVRSISLRTDVKILLLTIPAVLGLRKGF